MTGRSGNGYAKITLLEMSQIIDCSATNVNEYSVPAMNH
jgi:hypothetical protein